MVGSERPDIFILPLATGTGITSLTHCPIEFEHMDSCWSVNARLMIKGDARVDIPLVHLYGVLDVASQLDCALGGIVLTVGVSYET